MKNWYRSGKLRLEANYKDGQKNGLSTEWFENGKKQSEGTYRDDKKDSVVYLWDKDGKLVKEDKFELGNLVWSKNYLSGNIFKGDGYYEVFNGMNDFFMLEITGKKVSPKSAEDITYAVDGNLLQVFERPITDWIDDEKDDRSEKEKLAEIVKQESKYISAVTNFEIDVKSDFQKTSLGKTYSYWHFVSPSSKDKEQKPRTVQEEHYITFVVGNRVLSLYSVVTNNDDSKKIKQFIERIANTLKVKEERIDLNAIANSIK